MGIMIELARWEDQEDGWAMHPGICFRKMLCTKPQLSERSGLMAMFSCSITPAVWSYKVLRKREYNGVN